MNGQSSMCNLVKGSQLDLPLAPWSISYVEYLFLLETALLVSDPSHVKKEHLPQSHPKKRTRQPPESIAMSVRWREPTERGPLLAQNHEAPQLRTIGGKNEGVVFKVLTAGLSVSSSADLVLTLPRYPHGDLPRRVGLLEPNLEVVHSFLGVGDVREAARLTLEVLRLAGRARPLPQYMTQHPGASTPLEEGTALDEVEAELKRAREEATAYSDEKFLPHRRIGFIQRQLYEKKRAIVKIGSTHEINRGQIRSKQQALKKLEAALLETTKLKESQLRILTKAKREYDGLLVAISEVEQRLSMEKALLSQTLAGIAESHQARVKAEIDSTVVESVGASLVRTVMEDDVLDQLLFGVSDRQTCESGQDGPSYQVDGSVGLSAIYFTEPMSLDDTTDEEAAALEALLSFGRWVF
ncbi:hypothetical protein DFJ73DRAFT_763051 [Zopfochytrium polystomum]|nr:hypothetical protein DFJ73DRAFT_763051 [Zopfochytrium polystomum]